MFKSSRHLLIAVLALAALAALLAAAITIGANPRAPDLPSAIAIAPGPGMSGELDGLVDTRGHRISEADFGGDWRLVYFGYSFCPDICPTELADMIAAIDQLPPGLKVTPVFVTVDPDRDTPHHLADYVALFDSRLVGLSGDAESIEAAKKRFRVWAARRDDPDMNDYMMDHTNLTYLVAPGGQLVEIYRGDAPPSEMAAAIARRMGAMPAN